MTAERGVARGSAGGTTMPRRSFLGRFLGVAASMLGAAVVYPVLRYLSPPRIPEAVTNRVLAAKVSELTGEGWKVFPFGSEPGILVKVGSGEYRAFSATCTHLQCTVQYDPGAHRIWCACHNGQYDLNGRNVSGPPPRPLTPFKVQVDGDDIYVERG